MAIVAASLSLATGTATLFLLKESLQPENRSHKTKENTSLLKNWGLVFRRPILMEIILLALAMMFVTGTFETIFPLWTQSRFVWGPMEVGYCMTYIGLIVTLVQALVVGRIVPILGEARVIRLTFIGYATGLIIMAQSPSWIIMLLGLTIAASSGAAFGTATSSFVSKVAGDKEKGFVLGVYQSSSWLGRISGPLAAGAVFWFYWGECPSLPGSSSFGSMHNRDYNCGEKIGCAKTKFHYKIWVSSKPLL